MANALKVVEGTTVLDCSSINTIKNTNNVIQPLINKRKQSKNCILCNKKFSRVWSLQRHMTDRHFYIKQNLSCNICGKYYRSRNSLISHKSQYHGDGLSSKIKKC